MSTLTENHPGPVMGHNPSSAGSWLEQQPHFTGANKLLKGSTATYEAHQPQQSHAKPIEAIGQLVSKMPYRSFHSIRRAFATELSIAEVPLTSVSQMLGHLSIDSDRPYLSFNRRQTLLCATGFCEIPLPEYNAVVPDVNGDTIPVAIDAISASVTVLLITTASPITQFKFV